jgi:hypothetical protein
MLNHVDLRIADQEGGFAASFTSYGNDTEGSLLTSRTVEVGTIDVPRLNIVGSAIAGIIGAAVFIIVSRMNEFSAAEVVVEHYYALKAMYEKEAIDDGNADGPGKGDGVDNYVYKYVDVERG